MKVLRPTVALLGVLLGGLRAAGQSATVVVPDAPSCAKCTITLRSLVTIGVVDGPGSFSTVPNSVKVDGRGRFWVTQEAEMPMVFDRTGQFVQSIGQNGEGPGEFIAAFSTMPLTDSVLVFDRTGHATMVGPDLRPGRTISVPLGLGGGTMITWPSLVFLQNGLPPRDGPPAPIARVRFSPSGVEVLGSFGPDRGDLSPRLPLLQVLGEVRLGRVWSADVSSRYRLSQWSTAGLLERSLERKPDWFVNPSDGSARSMAQPGVRAIQEDSAGLVWVFVSVSRPRWRDALPKPGVREIAMRQIALEKLYRTHVEVIDPRTARVVAQRVLDEWIVAALPNGRAAVYSVDEQGTPRISIVQISLQAR